MTTSYDVKFWDIRRNKSSKTASYEVRWKVGGREKSKTLRTKALAENFLSDLRQAARRGEAFDVERGLPESLVKAKTARTWLEFAQAYVLAKWPHSAAKSREGITDTMTGVTLALLRDRPGKPELRVLRSVLRGHVFLPDGRRGSLDPEHAVALRWLTSASLPMVELKEAKTVRAVLEALSVTLDGTRAADSTFRRKRAVFHHALEYAVELGDLSANPLDRVNWKPAKVSGEVDRRVVVNPAQARELLVAVTYIGRSRGAMLAGMFACMYFAGLRPAEAAGLREKDCHLPATGWGLLTLEETRPESGRRFSDSGSTHDVRGLKQRRRKAIRDVPIPPELVRILREHVELHGTAADGRLFRTATGGVFSTTAYAKVWKEARTYALIPDQVASPLAGRPYDLRHAAVSLWLNAGVPAPDVAERAGHSVDVLLRVYAKCVDGQREIANQRIAEALSA
ncbi:integrase [Sphaerisporangium siamense]|uniref:Integrase n=1 Tax=Sphaerisporangium siamense TaxID=795645 RepID=A0A7W7GA03_9ACTN|nr:site-specific integrase [Sphaerisporangium siamense]MBB4701932.1 integrase [Sphaerisporangium siamense]GII84156.1 integrase [Sphaerisporangium siamense]